MSENEILEIIENVLHSCESPQEMYESASDILEALTEAGVFE